MPPLTEAKIKSIKKSGKIERYHDRQGLYLELSVAGGKHWRFKYSFAGKEKRLSFGPWPEVSLKEAREKRDDARKALRDGVDPRSLQENIGKGERGERSFEDVAREWVEGRVRVWSERHTETVVERLMANVYPKIGHRPISGIEPVDVLDLVKAIEARGALEVARRVLGICSMIFRYAVAMQLVPSDPCRDLRGALAQRVAGHFAALTSKEDVGDLLCRIDKYQGTVIVRSALKFTAFTFCRPGSVRMAEWTEIDFADAVWRVPSAKMKLTKEMKLRKEAHVVPLATQVIDLLQKMQHFTGKGKYIFPSIKNKNEPMSDNAMTTALRRMGFSREMMTAHGFRATASTLLNEVGFRLDVIEAQLAHSSADKIRAIYNRAQYMEERRKLMQAWADMLDRYRSDAVARVRQRTP